MWLMELIWFISIVRKKSMLNGFDFNTLIHLGNVPLLHLLGFCHDILRWCNSEIATR